MSVLEYVPEGDAPEGDFYSQTAMVLILRGIQRMSEAKLPPEKVPPLQGYCASHGYRDLPTRHDFERAFSMAAGSRSLPLPESLRGEEALRDFFERPPGRPCRIELQDGGSYNTRRVLVTADQASLVFFGDPYSKLWRARIDGAPAVVLPALGAFKAVPVPAGRSTSRLRFEPPLVGGTLFGAYLLLAGLAILVLRLPDIVDSHAPLQGSVAPSRAAS